MAETKKDYVTFENSLGEEISNDPRWHAERVLADAGVEGEKDQRIAELEAALREATGSSEVRSADDAEMEGDDDTPDVDPATGTRTYKELDSKALKALAAEREVDITGLTKVGQVRQALVDADAGRK